jgi:hypothetical protein
MNRYGLSGTGIWMVTLECERDTEPMDDDGTDWRGCFMGLLFYRSSVPTSVLILTPWSGDD